MKIPFSGISLSGSGRGVLFLFLLLGASWRPAAAFGALGHQTIAALAEDMLTPKAKAGVKALLGPAGGPASLASIALWADDIRMLRPETRPWHYATLQLDQAGYDSATADSADVIKALKRQLAILADTAADRYAREEALKWVVHLTGDLHQPLHVGEDHDKGGNLATVKVNRRSYNLHEVWDHVLLDRLRLPLDSLHAMLAREIAADTGSVARRAAGTVESWADETHAKAAACYTLHGARMRKGIKVQLDKEYVNSATLIVLAQLKLAGMRLAHALNQALDPGGRTAAPAVRPSAGGRTDPGAFFARADAIKDTEGADKAEPSREARRAGNQTGPAGAPPGKYLWSVNSDLYHFRACADAARIKRRNLRSGDRPPRDRRLHPGCPVTP